MGNTAARKGEWKHKTKQNKCHQDHSDTHFLKRLKRPKQAGHLLHAKHLPVPSRCEKSSPPPLSNLNQRKIHTIFVVVVVWSVCLTNIKDCLVRNNYNQQKCQSQIDTFNKCVLLHKEKDKHNAKQKEETTKEDVISQKEEKKVGWDLLNSHLMIFLIFQI